MLTVSDQTGEASEKLFVRTSKTATESGNYL